MDDARKGEGDRLAPLLEPQAVPHALEHVLVEMGVGVDKSGGKELSRGVEHRFTAIGGKAPPDFGDLIALHQHVGVSEHLIGRGDHIGGVFNQQHGPAPPIRPRCRR
ncbi:hypothetical protein SDC9_143312 [bioreactor metagenome]|uniref:Uncharacterized protein n=1 Tax=bioreactor metagenome TaxID=1076179 RepID=A0A645E3R3_9ZZZZ